MEEVAFKGTIKEGCARKFTIINENDFEQHLTEAQQDYYRTVLNNIAALITEGREKEGKPPYNNYVVINIEEPFINDIVRVLDANNCWDGLPPKGADEIE